MLSARARRRPQVNTKGTSLLRTGKDLLFLDCVYAPAFTMEKTCSLGKANVQFDKVLNQRVDWVAWASIQIYGARDEIDDACTTSCVLPYLRFLCVQFKGHSINCARGGVRGWERG